jgi:hypothetical protein
VVETGKGCESWTCMSSIGCEIAFAGSLHFERGENKSIWKSCNICVSNEHATQTFMVPDLFPL